MDTENRLLNLETDNRHLLKSVENLIHDKKRLDEVNTLVTTIEDLARLRIEQDKRIERLSENLSSSIEHINRLYEILNIPNK